MGQIKNIKLHIVTDIKFKTREQPTRMWAINVVFICFCIQVHQCINNSTRTASLVKPAVATTTEQPQQPQPQQQQQQQQQQQKKKKQKEVCSGVSMGVVVFVVILELIVVVMLCGLVFRCWYMNKKASWALMNDRTKLTSDKSMLARYDETMT